MRVATPAVSGTILAINSGSSSLKVGFYADDADTPLRLLGSADGIGRQDGALRLTDAAGRVLLELSHLAESQVEALERLIEASRPHLHGAISCVGHRVVHGGPSLTTHQPITPQLEQTLRDSIHFAPLHIPAALRLIAAAERLFPAVEQIACFDTAFHRTMPEVARRLPLPAEYARRGVQHYGFHGISYESIVHQLGEPLPARAIIAQLGNGSSLCALREGVSIDTTMGMTPTGGVVMATRSGDLDPGVLLFLLRSEGLDADALEDLLNHRAGLAALSGGESDMRSLLERAAHGDGDAALAVDAYVISIRKAIGAYAALLGGVDRLIFTGGIGEHSAVVRARIGDGLDAIGISPARTLVIPTDEERQIARITRQVRARHVRA
jgi:acetate kinase